MGKQRTRVIANGVAVEMEQSLRVLGPDEMLQLIDIPTEFLLAELIRRKELSSNGTKDYHYYIHRAVDCLLGQEDIVSIMEHTALEYTMNKFKTKADAARALGISRPKLYDMIYYRNSRGKRLKKSLNKIPNTLLLTDHTDNIGDTIDVIP